MSSVTFTKNEKRNAILKIVLALIILLLSTYVIKACAAANAVPEANIVEKKYYKDDLTTILYFRTETFGNFYKYEYDEEDPEQIINETRYAFNYIIKDNTITLSFINSIDDLSLIFIKDGLLDIKSNTYYFLLT